MFVTDKQWQRIAPYLAVRKRGRRGRPRRPLRPIFEAVLFILRTGIQWRYLPAGFPPKSTVHDYLKLWAQRQVFWDLVRALLQNWNRAGQFHREEGFIDATFAPAKQGGEGVGLTRKGKGTKIQIIVDPQGVVLSASLASADTGEPQMVPATVGRLPAENTPQRLIGDKAYDSDALDESLAQVEIEMIAPHRRNRKAERRTQDGRKLKRSARRWIVERTIAWLQNYRRVLVRHEKSLSIYQAFIALACFMILLKKMPLFE